MAATTIVVSALFLSLLQAATEPLKTGKLLPVIQGETLDGKSLELPAAASGKITFLAFSFSREGGSSARQWVQRFEKEFAHNSSVEQYSVMFLEGVPRLLRGLVSSGIRRGFPKDRHPYAVRVYKDEQVWKERLGITKDDDAPCLALLDQSGKILWMYSGQFSEDRFNDLLKVLAA